MLQSSKLCIQLDILIYTCRQCTQSWNNPRSFYTEIKYYTLCGSSVAIKTIQYC